MKWLVTGDTHGAVAARLMNIGETDYPKDDTAIIILGDAGINFYLNKTDAKNKKIINNMGYRVYCVRGNHEERPENLSYIVYIHDHDVNGWVIYEPDYPNIRYLIDGNTYLINGHSVLVIGGAYSVDKWYRLSRAPEGAKWTGWFEQEQLDTEEMSEIERDHAGNHYDFVLSHTCPESWQPFDLFLSGLDQSTVDKTMEVWLENFRHKITYDVWLFGHFHDDRLVRPHVEMYYTDIEELETIYHRWTSGEEIPWWLKKDPNYEAVL